MHHRLLAGTAGGTLLSTLAQLQAHDVLQTVALSAIGAVVSFIVTLILQRWLRRK